VSRYCALARRREQILAHFGDPQQHEREGRCCSVCDPDPELALAAASDAPTRKRQPASASPMAAFANVPGKPVDEAQYEKLKAWRRDRAEGRPAYTVAANAVLEEILRRRPASAGELIEIRGIGPAFCEKHGESLLVTLAGL
jgi:ATP-dependent DNA helicase RecQ